MKSVRTNIRKGQAISAGNWKRFERLVYGAGQVLTATDLQAEQDYFRRKIQLQNRNLLGACIFDGLGVELIGDVVIVNPGLAYDCTGRELIVEERITVELTDVDVDGRCVLLEFEESPISTRPSFDATDDVQPSRVIEGVRAYIGDTDIPKTHERTSRGWIACNRCLALPIAKLKNGMAVIFA